jgi:hypothetical protein
LIGLVDLLAAGLSTLERLPEDMDGYAGLARTCWRLFAWFGRALAVPPLTALLVFFVLVVPRIRHTIGDALAWSTDEASHASVTQHVLARLQRHPGSSRVLVGHSQGGSILAELEPTLRASGGDVRLVTLGSGHGLLAAVERLLPTWSPAKSLVAWSALLVYATLAILAVASATLTLVHPVVPIMPAPFKSGAAAWLMQSVPSSLTESLLREGTHLGSALQGKLLSPIYLPPLTLPALLAGSVVAVLIITLAVKPARLLNEAVGSDAKGVDIVATHDLVAAAMLQLSRRDRLRRVRQCESLWLDHTTYLSNACTVLPLIAAQVEQAAGLRPDAEPSEEDRALEGYQEAGLTLRGWTRPLLAVLAALIIGFIGVGRLPTALWGAIAVICVAAISFAISASSAKWLRDAIARASFDPALATALERARRGRASRWWALLLFAMAFPLVSGAAIALAYPAVSRAVSHHQGLWALTILAASVGIVLSALAWLSLFGARSVDWAPAVLLAAALAWFMQGTAWGGEMGAFTMLVAAVAVYRTRRRRKRELAALAVSAGEGGASARHLT